MHATSSRCRLPLCGFSEREPVRVPPRLSPSVVATPSPGSGTSRRSEVSRRSPAEACSGDLAGSSQRTRGSSRTLLPRRFQSCADGVEVFPDCGSKRTDLGLEIRSHRADNWGSAGGWVLVGRLGLVPYRKSRNVGAYGAGSLSDVAERDLRLRYLFIGCRGTRLPRGVPLHRMSRNETSDKESYVKNWRGRRGWNGGALASRGRRRILGRADQPPADAARYSVTAWWNTKSASRSSLGLSKL